jgi:hypothetical protein
MQTSVESTSQARIRRCAQLLGVPVPDLQDGEACRVWVVAHADEIRRLADRGQGWLRAISEPGRRPDAERKLAGIYAERRRARKGQERPRPAVPDNVATEAQLDLVQRLYRGQVVPRSGSDADRLIRKGLAHQARKRARRQR